MCSLVVSFTVRAHEDETTTLPRNVTYPSSSEAALRLRRKGDRSWTATKAWKIARLIEFYWQSFRLSTHTACFSTWPTSPQMLSQVLIATLFFVKAEVLSFLDYMGFMGRVRWKNLWVAETKSDICKILGCLYLKFHSAQYSDSHNANRIESLGRQKTTVKMFAC
jgi:hypothetical protein